MKIVFVPIGPLAAVLSLCARLGVLVLVGTSTSTQNVRINGDLVRALAADRVQDFAFTPDGSRVVYSAITFVASSTLELFSRPLDASSPSVCLNGPLQPQGTVHRPSFSDGHGFLLAAGRVVFAADEEGDGVFELYSAPVDGSTSRVRLSQPGSTMLLLGVDPAGSRAVYRNRPTNSAYGPLHVAPVDGSTPPLTLWTSPGVRNAWVTPDGTRVVFCTEDVVRERLYVTPIDGSGTPLLLGITPQAAFDYPYYSDLVFTPGGDRTVYHHTVEIDGDFERTLHSVPLDGSQPAVQIPAYINFNFNLDDSSFVLDAGTPTRIGFLGMGSVLSTLADGTSSVTLSSAGSALRSWPKALGSELFFSQAVTGGQTILRVPSDGSLPATPVFPLHAGGIYERFTFASPQTLVFFDGGPVGRGRAYAVDLGTGVPVALQPTPPAGQGTLELIPHPGGQHVLLRGNLDTLGNTDLYVAPIDASQAPLRLSVPANDESDVVEVGIVPGGASVAYRSQTVTPQGQSFSDLLVVPIDASASPVQLNETRPGPEVGDVTHLQVSPGREVLVYRADQLEDEHFDLFAVATDDAGTPVLLSGSVPSVLADFTLLEQGPRVVFRAGTGLYVAGLTGGAPILLDSAAQGFGTDVAIASEEGRLVYRRTAAAGNFELRSVLLDGLSPSVRLHGPLPGNRSVTAFRVAADDTVVFRADLGQDEVFELHAVPAKGGMPRRLNAPLVTNGDVGTFALDARGKYVAFLADAVVDQRVELFALQLDGSRTPERRSGSLPARGNVLEFAFSADGRHLVYRADQVSDGRFDLFSTPILSSLGGAGGPRRRSLGTTLLSFLPSGRAVQPDWRLTADGSAVVYRANPNARDELWSVPIDGRARPTHLGDGPVLHGTVLSFALAEDRVVYRADQRVDERIELFSAPLDGGASVALDDLPAFGDVTAFQLALDAREVVFRADRDADEVLELYRAPIDGSASPRRVNGPLASDGDAQTDFVALEGGTLYRADQELDEVFELFLTR